MPSLGQLGSAVAGGSVIGGAVVRLVLDDTQFSSGLARAEGELKATTSSTAATTTKATTGIGAAFTRMSGAAQIAVIAAGAALVKFTADSVAAFQEHQQVLAQTEAVLKSTGGAANVTAGQVEDLANQIRDYSGVDDEAVQASENLLLTFRAVQNQAGANNDIFTQSTKAIVDMATALNSGATPSMEDLHSATLQLGKALNDPVVGLTALRRVGVSFTASQADMIKGLAQSGHLLEAQKLILQEVEKEFGGAAKAAGDTFGGAIAKLSSHFNDLKEALGQGVTPLISAFAKGLNALLPVLVPLARNLYLVLGAFGGFLAVRALPDILLGLAGGMEAIGAAGAADSILGLAAGLAALTAPEILGGLAVLYTGFQAFQRVTGNGGPLFDPKITNDLATKITGWARAAGALPGPLEAVKAAQAGMNQVFAAGRPLLEQMGTSMRDFVTAANAAASKGQTAFQQFADKTLVSAADAIQKWQQATSDSLNFVDDALASFAGKSHVAASQIVKAFQVAANQQQQFGKDIQTIMQRGGADARGLAQQLIGMGKDGVAAAHAIAGANNKAFNSIVQGYAKGAAAADKLSASLSGKIIGSLHDIEAILQAIARKWGVNIVVNDKQANAAAGSTQHALEAIPTKITSVITANANQAISAAHAAASALNAVPNQITSTITTISRHITQNITHGATGGIFKMGAGGITQGPVYQFGEGSYSTFAGRGAEAVIPLNDRTMDRLSARLNKGRGGHNINVTINTQGAMDPNQLAASVSRHLSRTIREEALV